MLRQIDPPFCDWLAGLIDGEGCFLIDRNNGIGYGARFFVKLRDDDSAVLRDVHERTGLGTLLPAPRRGNSHPQLKWFLASKEDCVRLVAILEAHPLRSKKAGDFELWAEAVRLWVARQKRSRWHQEGDDWEAIADLRRRLRARRAYAGPS